MDKMRIITTAKYYKLKKKLKNKKLRKFTKRKLLQETEPNP